MTNNSITNFDNFDAVLQFSDFNRVDIDVDILNQSEIDEKIIQLIRKNSSNFNDDHTNDDDIADQFNINMINIIDNNALNDDEHYISMKIHFQKKNSDDNELNDDNLTNLHQTVFEFFNLIADFDSSFRSNRSNIHQFMMNRIHAN